MINMHILKDINCIFQNMLSRNFWHNYDIKQRIKFNLEFKNGEKLNKLNIEVLWENDSQFRILFEDLSGILGLSH